MNGAPVTRQLSWAAVAAVVIIAAYFGGADTSRAGALEPPPPPPLVPANFEVPSDFPGAVRALEQLTGATASPVMVRDSLGAALKVSGGSVVVPTELSDSILAGAQRHFLARGFLLVRHEGSSQESGGRDALVLLPMWDQYRAVKLIGTNVASRGIANAQVIDWLRALERDEPFVLTGIGYGQLEGRFASRVADPTALAQRIYVLCPGGVGGRHGSVAELAADLRRLNAFACRWS